MSSVRTSRRRRPFRFTGARIRGGGWFRGGAVAPSPGESTVSAIGRRVVVLSASVGAGHDAAAAELSRRLTEAGATVQRYDFLDLLPAGVGRWFKGLYALELRVAPRTWGWVCSVLQRFGVMTTILGALTGLLAARRMRKVLGSEVDTVVSTYLLASQAAGRLRRAGKLSAPVLTYLTDVSVHRIWIHRGVDTYLAPHQVTAEQARTLGGRDVRVVAPAVPPVFSPLGGPDPAEARRRFGLPETGRLALVVAGAWAVGDVEQTARDIADTGEATPVVVCATNTALRESLRKHGTGIALGWVDDMPTLMRACDVVVSNAGGVSSVEAMASGVPVVIYRCLPGHGRTNAEAFAASGLARWITDESELGAGLVAAAAERNRARRVVPLASRTDPAEVIAGAVDAVPRRTVQVRKLRRRLSTVAAAVAVGLSLSTVGTGTAVAHGFRAARPSAGDTGRVFLVAELPDDRPTDPAVLRELAGSHAAIAVSEDLAERQPQTVQDAAAAGLPLVNAGPGRPYETGVLSRRGALGRTALDIHRLTGTFPALMLSDGSVDALDVASAAWYHERIVVPSNTRSYRSGSGASAMPVQGGKVVLVGCGSHPNCQLDGVLNRVAGAAQRQQLSLSPITELA